VRTIAGVSDVAFATSLPPNDLWLRNDYTVEGTAPDAAGASNVAAWIPVSESYFDALHIGIVQGRAFSAQDRDGAPAVAIVDEAFVRRHYPDGNATGKRLKGGTWDDSAPWITIVGVARNVSYDGGVWGGGEPTVYTAYTQNLWATTPFVVVRASGDAGALMTRVRAAVRDIDPSLPLRDVATMEERVHDSMAAPRLRGRLFVLLAGIALALAITGIYGLIAYDVNQHRQDIAVRRAFGAPTGAVVGGVLRSGMQLVAAGGVAGIIGALLAGRLLGSLLYGVTARDVQALVVSCLAIVIAALAACVIPALNAARVDPMRALRQE
jgi:predicted permease